MASLPESTLESFHDLTIHLTTSVEPWTLDLQALVVAVGPGGPGGLGRAMSSHVPSAFGPGFAYERVTPEHPISYRLNAASVSTAVFHLQSIILATAHDSQGQESVPPSSPATVEAAATGLASALQLADDSGFTRVGATLLGTGVLGLDPAAVAAASAARIRKLISQGNLLRLQHIVLIAGDELTRNAIEQAWSQSTSATSSGPTAADLTHLIDSFQPPVQLSGTAAAVLAKALQHRVTDRFLFPERDSSVVPEELLLAALEHHAGHGRSDVAAAMVRQVVQASASASGGDASGVAGKVSAALGAQASSAASDSSGSAHQHDVADVSALIEQAAAHAVRTIGRRYVRQRHLLAAALSTRPLIAPVQQALGVEDAVLRRCLRAAIGDVLPTESPAVWDEILLSPRAVSASPTDSALSSPPTDSPPAGGVEDVRYSDTDLAGGYSTDLVNPDDAIPAADDLLGINTYVSMLANVIASSDTPLPLSIGLFGEWGSGKSFFMGRLRQQVAELAEQDGYLSRVEQIGFNAWHYADTNLWASLGDEIFRQLARPQATEQNALVRKLEEARRSQLELDLGKHLTREHELATATENAQRTSTELKIKLDGARDKQQRAATVLLTSVAESPTLQKQLRRAWQRLGISDDVERGELLASEIRGVHQNFDTFRRATAGPRGIALAALATLSVLLIAAGALASDAVREWLIRLGLFGVLGGLATVTALIGRVGAGARLLAQVATEAQQARAGVVSANVRDRVAELDKADAEAEILANQLGEVRARVGEIGRQLAELAPGQRLYGFVADRAASQDYRGELGLISTIRRDFQTLIELMQDWRDHPAEHGNHAPIDRIVLYIDDLDRCSPHQVVEVLQAVHLLLALDLFVVVVGVDPRWLLHSLGQRYEENLTTSSGDTPAPPDASGWDATPLNYLEKIFNIPFVLPGMTGPSFADLISGWSGAPALAAAEPTVTATTRAVVTVGADAEVSTPEPEPGTQSVDNDGESQPPGLPAGSGVAAEVPIDQGSSVDRLGRGLPSKPRPLSPREIEHLQALAPLVPTPREAKRVFNLYRTLRASGNLSPASVFLGDEQNAGEFQAVILLLGLLTAEPRLVGELLWSRPDDPTGVAGGICYRQAPMGWPELLVGLTPRSGPNGWCNDLGQLPSGPGGWQQILPRLVRASALVSLPDLTAFQRWGPLVAQFSFVLSPLAGDTVINATAGPRAATADRSGTGTAPG